MQPYEMPERAQGRWVAEVQPKGMAVCKTRRDRCRNKPRAAGPVPVSTVAAECVSSARNALDAGQCAKLIEDLKAGGAAQAAAVDSLRGSVLSYAFDSNGCHVVQDALTVCSTKVAAELVVELHDHVREAIRSHHANYVIQKVIEALPSAHSSFIAEALRGSVAATARHRFGCRILCRLLEHATTEAFLAPLLDELLNEACRLCCHPFAHHVLESVMVNGLEAQRRHVVGALLDNVLTNALDRHGVFLFQAVLSYGCAEDKEALVKKLLAQPNAVLELARSRYGACVLQAVCENAPGSVHSSSIHGQLLLSARELMGDKRGRRLLAELGLGPVVGLECDEDSLAVAAAIAA